MYVNLNVLGLVAAVSLLVAVEVAMGMLVDRNQAVLKVHELDLIDQKGNLRGRLFGDKDSAVVDLFGSSKQGQPLLQSTSRDGSELCLPVGNGHFRAVISADIEGVDITVYDRTGSAVKSVKVRNDNKLVMQSWENGIVKDETVLGK